MRRFLVVMIVFCGGIANCNATICDRNDFERKIKNIGLSWE